MAAGSALSFLTNAGWLQLRLSALHARLLSARAIRVAYTAAIPIGVFSVAATVLIQAGPVTIEALRGNVEAGQYGAGLRLVEMLQLLPSIVCAAVLPRLSSLHGAGDGAGFRRVLRLSMLGLGASNVVIAAGLAWQAPRVVALLAPSAARGGAFEATGALLQVLGWASPLMALAMLLSFALIAADGQRALARIVTAAAAANAGLLLVLVPRYGALGAAAALLACQAAVVVLCYGRVRHVGAPHAVAGPLFLPLQQPAIAVDE